MNYPLLSKLFGMILGVVSLAFLTSLVVGFAFIDLPGERHSMEGLGVSFAVTILIAFVFWILGRKASGQIFRKEALCLIGLSWLMTSFFGALPYYLILENCSFADAFFESASGLTTTGASVFTNFEEFPKSLLFWRSMSQWIGGLGVVVLFVALLASLGAGAKLLFSNESSASSTDIEESRVQKGAWYIMGYYSILTAICAVCLHQAGMDWFDSISHAFTTLSTGGFSTKSSSIEYFQSATIEWIIILFMVLGGTSFFVQIKAIRARSFQNAVRNSETSAYYILWIVASFILAGILFYHEWSLSIHDTIRGAIFQVITVMTTTGFATTDFDLWAVSAKYVLLLLMIVGGSSGSTAGGVKVFRVILACKIMARAIERSYRSHVIRPLKSGGKRISEESQITLMTYLVLVALVCLLSFLIISIAEPSFSFRSSLSAVFACFFNIGPGFDQVGPTKNFGEISVFSKYFLSILMVMGRLELYAVLVLLKPSLWKKFS